MTAIDGFLMWAVTLALASLAAWIKEKIWPGRSAEECGYIPGSEAPPWGWPLTILGTIAVIAIFVGLFGYVGSAVFLG